MALSLVDQLVVELDDEHAPGTLTAAAALAVGATADGAEQPEHGGPMRGSPATTGTPRWVPIDRPQ